MLNVIKDYFSLTQTEWRGYIVLLVLIVLAFIVPRVYMMCLPAEKLSEREVEKLAKQIELFNQPNDLFVEEEIHDEQVNKESIDQHQPSYFFFDPNTVTYEELLLLGCKENVAKVFINYRNTGVVFYKPEDIRKIYGITDVLFNEWRPYISIHTTTDDKKPPEEKEETKSLYSKYESVAVEINSADSAQFTKLKGIGPVYAQRIIKYRNLLGGFYEKKQLMEVYGLDSTLFMNIEKQVLLEDMVEPTIAINEISSYQLGFHPYISNQQANAIILYRESHGIFKEENDLFSIYALDSATIKKIAPYLSYE